MKNFNDSVLWFNRIKPKFGDELWLRATKVLNELGKKSVKDRETKERLFIYLVDEIYKKL